MRVLKVKDWLNLQKKITKEDVLKAHNESIAKKWEASGLLEGLKGMRKSNIAQLFESQASSMLNELSIEPVPDTFKAKGQ
jgi:hypothetical protein